MQGTNCGCTSSLLKALAAQGADNPTADALGIVDIDSEFDGNLSQLASEAAAAQCPKGFTHRQGEVAARHAFETHACCGCQAPNILARKLKTLTACVSVLPTSADACDTGLPIVLPLSECLMCK